MRAIESSNTYGVQPRLRLHKIQSKTQKRRTPLGPLNLNNHSEHEKLEQPIIKRSVSIVNMVRRLSITSLNKKAQQIFYTLSKMPKKDRHLMTAQIKCFMISKHTHDSHLLDQKIVAAAIEKLKNSDRILKLYSFNYNKFVHLCEIVIKKSGDTLTLIKSYEECMGEMYPPSVEMMLLYFGVFFYSINSRYLEAEKCCQKLFDLIVKFKVEQFFIIYLILRIKLKTNLYEWQDSLRLLTKLLFFSWMYNLNDLQIWCYFQFSRAYFFLQQQPQSHLFKQKSESNTVQPKRSLYREVSISNLIMQIQKIWQGQLDFKYDYVIEDNRLFLPKTHHYGVEDYISDQRKLKSNIKSIISDCKIRHVGNLLTRIGEIGMHSMMGAGQGGSCGAIGGTQSCGLGGSKTDITSPNFSPNSSTNNFSNNLANQKSGNNFLLTHKSYNKNMCMFFRKRTNDDSSSSNRIFYTIENSQKNWSVLKEMIKNIFLEMSFWSPHVTLDK